MQYLIYDNQIAGSAVDPQNLPSGFSIAEGVDVPINQLYWDGEQIQIKPEQPTPAHIWDSSTHSWEFPLSPSVPISLDWDKLISLLDSSPEWGKAYSAAERTLKANTAFTTLLTTLTTLRKIETLEFAIAKLREAMIGISGIGDFTAEEIVSINQKLTACGFDLQLS